LGALLDDPKAKAVVDQYMPGLSSNPMVAMAKGFSLRMLVGMPQAAQMGVTEEKVQAVLDEINKLV
jgi:hypothetical protein